MIAVLTSGVALGVHVPGLLLARRLAARGIDVTVDVFERLLPEEARTRIGRSQDLFRRDFRAALAGQALARDLGPVVDARARDDQWQAWRDRGVDRFVILSGFWWPVVDGFVRSCGGRRPPALDRCHVDSVPSPSWRVHDGGAAVAGRDVWLLDAAAGTVPWTIPVTADEPRPWSERQPRLLCHGGGWGMGTYRARARELADRGLVLDLVLHDPADADTDADAGISGRRFLIDPAWQPWHDDGFPPFGELRADRTVTFGRRADHHDAFDLARAACAIVSKPGGGTLLDSLWSATPVVLIEPFGRHESANAGLWQRLGFGVGLEEWTRLGCPLDLLEQLHHNLQAARPGIPSYVDALAGRPDRRAPMTVES